MVVIQPVSVINNTKTYHSREDGQRKGRHVAQKSSYDKNYYE